MTTKKETNKATHRGTCQACGRAQAHFKGAIAKHGYTVDWGHFNGICLGAEAQALEHDKTITERMIKELREIIAPRADQLAVDLEAGRVEPTWTKYDFRTGEYVAVVRAALSDYQQQQIISCAIHKAQRDAVQARSHAKMLETLIATRHGQPLMPINAKHELSVGDRVLIGGKKGVVCEVVALRMQVARGCGAYLNGQTILHALLKRENGNIIAVPARSIRQSAIVTGGAL